MKGCVWGEGVEGEPWDCGRGYAWGWGWGFGALREGGTRERRVVKVSVRAGVGVERRIAAGAWVKVWPVQCLVGRY